MAGMVSLQIQINNIRTKPTISAVERPNDLQFQQNLSNIILYMLKPNNFHLNQNDIFKHDMTKTNIFQTYSIFSIADPKY